MTKETRKKILSKAVRIMRKENPQYDSMLPGKKEQIQDKYITQVCESEGTTLSEFYAADAKELNGLLNPLY